MEQILSRKTQFEICCHYLSHNDTIECNNDTI